jgi:hypothetical protein
MNLIVEMVFVVLAVLFVTAVGWRGCETIQSAQRYHHEYRMKLLEKGCPQ